MKVIICQNAQLLAEKTASLIVKQLLIKPDSTLGLATGGTPKATYRQLIAYHAQGLVSFRQAKTVNLDEYLGLAKDHPSSYAHYMQTQLFSHIDILPENTYLLDGLTDNAERECARYEQQIATLGGIDLQLLGIGANGHIGFNEPAERFNKSTRQVKLARQTRQDNARFFEHIDAVPQYALSMGLKPIMQARKILLLANGEAKAQAVLGAIKGAIDPQLPASILQLHPDVTLLLDGEAAHLLMQELNDKLTTKELTTQQLTGDYYVLEEI